MVTIINSKMTIAVAVTMIAIKVEEEEVDEIVAIATKVVAVVAEVIHMVLQVQTLNIIDFIRLLSCILMSYTTLVLDSQLLI